MGLGDVDKLLYHKRKVMFFGLDPDDECWGFAVPVEEIDKAPTIDAVPVVRCLNCKYKGVLWRETICEHPNGMLHKVKPDDFCSYGKRKEAEHDKHPSDPV
jgi:hypothetical protein